MLSQETIDIVKATAPVLEQHGETLTRHFYKRMFEQNPEVAPFFNSSNNRVALKKELWQRPSAPTQLTSITSKYSALR